MRSKVAMVVGVMALLETAALAEAQKPAGAKPATYDVTITTDSSAYTGTMVLAVAAGKVSGSMHIKAPTEVTGKPAGAAKAGELVLDFPYHMVERKCDGDIRMNIKMPDRKVAGAKATGTVSIGGCGRPPDSRLSGTIELTPAAGKK